MATDDELMAELAAALEPPRREPPAESIAELRRRALESTPAADGEASPQIPPTTPLVVPAGRRLRRLALSGVAAAALFGAGFITADRIKISTDDYRTPATGESVVEFAGRLEGPSDGSATDPSRATARATVRKTGIGRVIELSSTTLAILPKGEFYEVWFVGPGDTPQKPNRISAGTFHPDEAGRTRVRFAAAVDPKKYPTLLVTAEPGSGNPAPEGPTVVRGVIGDPPRG